ncbi:MAG TPA: hypothetical protein VND93_14085 [Myxococcales bacterium]|nr:hypothetical protein [Myxococcales bacterium]
MDFEERIRWLKDQLDRDDARGSVRGQIGQAYLAAGDADSAEKWFLEAARHAEWSEIALVPLTWAKRAARANPTSLVARREYARQWQRSGMPGDPPPPDAD